MRFRWQISQLILMTLVVVGFGVPFCYGTQLGAEDINENSGKIGAISFQENPVDAYFASWLDGVLFCVPSAFLAAAAGVSLSVRKVCIAAEDGAPPLAIS